MCVLAETVNVGVLGEGGFDTKVLRFKDKRVADSGEESLVSP